MLSRIRMLLKDFVMSERTKESSWLKKSDVERMGILLFLLFLERTGLIPARGMGGKSLPMAACRMEVSVSLPSAYSFKP